MTRIARAWLRFLPRRFRERFGDDLVALMAASRARAGEAGGRLAGWRQGGREIASLVRLSLDLRRQARDTTTTRRAAGWWQDLRGALRHARRRPAASIAIVLTLSAAIAAVLLAVVLARSVLWRPLPFDDPERLYFVWESVARDGVPSPARVTRGRYLAWRDEGGAFDGLAMFAAWGLRTEGADGGRAIRGLRVSPNYFDVLGLTLLLGRGFAAAEAEPGAPSVIVLSHALWRELGARPDIVGADVRMSGDAYRVVGVMPPVVSPGFPVNPADVSLDPGQREFWVPLVATPALDANNRSHIFGVIGRLAEGRTAVEAQAALTATATPDGPEPHGAHVVSFRSQFVRDARTQVVVLLAAALAIFLIAVANLAALLASTFALRRGEFIVRSALGAGPWRLARQLALEAVVIAGVAGLMAMAVTQVLVRWLPSMLPPGAPLLTPPRLDGAAVAATALLVAGGALLISAWPLAKLGRGGEGARNLAARSRLHAYRAFIVAQVAVTLALVATAALLGRSLQHVYGRDAGFTIDRTLVAGLGVGAADGLAPEAINAVARDVLDAVLAVPGARAAAVAYDHPLAANWIDGYRLVGESPDAASAGRSAELRIVSPSYFDAFGVHVIDGRSFADDEGWTRNGVAVVNESLAREIGGDLIGRRLATGSPSRTWPGARTEFEIVGIVEDERFRGLEQPSRPAMYLSTWQFPQTYVQLLVRTDVEPLSTASVVREAVRVARPVATFDRVTSLDRILAEQLAGRRLTTGVVSTFGVLALVLAAIGLYGLVAVSVADRRREFGIRSALGATRASIVSGVVREGLRWTTIGAAAGLAIALAIGPLIASLLVDVPARDPITLGVVAMVLFGVTIAATVVPALRAAAASPSGLWGDVG